MKLCCERLKFYLSISDLLQSSMQNRLIKNFIIHAENDIILLDRFFLMGENQFAWNISWRTKREMEFGAG